MEHLNTFMSNIFVGTAVAQGSVQASKPLSRGESSPTEATMPLKQAQQIMNDLVMQVSAVQRRERR